MILVLVTGLQCKINDSTFDDTDVVKLTSESFDEFKEGTSTVVMFYTEWSERSNDFVDDYINIATDLGNVVNFGALDCDEYEDICHDYEVRDFPSLIIFKDKEHKFYKGPKNSVGILKEAKSEYSKLIEEYFEYKEEEFDDYDSSSYSNTTRYEDYKDTRYEDYNKTTYKDYNKTTSDFNLDYEVTTDFNSDYEVTTSNDNYVNSSHVLTSSCMFLFLTMIANIICY